MQSRPRTDSTGATRWLLPAAALVCSTILLAGLQEGTDQAQEQAGSKLPRVLIIGDSISLGYTPFVQKALSGKAEVVHAKGNNDGTTLGLAKLDEWLGKEPWDLIHFNWGLHDLKYIEGKQQVPLPEYEKNLTKLVQRLKKTGAMLIWCSTTPVPEGCTPPRTDADVVAYNAVAAKIMKANDIPTDDLYAFALPKLKEIQREANVHFLPEGSSSG